MLLTWGTVYAILSKNNLKANHNNGRCWPMDVRVYAILSKNNLKANHNACPLLPRNDTSICNLIKEQSESKSQHQMEILFSTSEYMQSYQRTIWKQITTSGTLSSSLTKVYAILSKNNLKANHNREQDYCFSEVSICNLIKEQSESKSQPRVVFKIYFPSICNLIKEQSESKSQRVHKVSEMVL